MTVNGYVQKAVNFDGEMFIIEQIQVYENPVAIKILRLSPSKVTTACALKIHSNGAKTVIYLFIFLHSQGQLYAGSESGVIQMPVSNCSRYQSCEDCVLSRDPYCAWDSTAEQCSSVYSFPASPKYAIQSLKEGNVSQCPPPGVFTGKPS